MESGEGIESSSGPPARSDAAGVESGEGIESSELNLDCEPLAHFLWNPVKELKVLVDSSIQYVGIFQWNPVKELKVA